MLHPFALFAEGWKALSLKLEWILGVIGEALALADRTHKVTAEEFPDLNVDRKTLLRVRPFWSSIWPISHC